MRRPVEHFQSVINWEGGDGSSTLFWLDSWLIDQPSRNR